MPPVAGITSNPVFNLGRTLDTEDRLIRQSADQQARLFSAVSGVGRAPSLGDFARTQAGIGLARAFIPGWIQSIKDWLKSISDLSKIGSSHN